MAKAFAVFPSASLLKRSTKRLRKIRCHVAWGRGQRTMGCW